MPKPIKEDGPSFKAGYAKGFEAARKEQNGHMDQSITELELLDKLLTGLLKRMDRGGKDDRHVR